MKRVVGVLALLLAGISQPMLSQHAAAQDVSELKANSQVVIEYVEPTKPYLRSVYDRMKQRQFLEQLQQFLSPLRLPVTLPIRMLECGETNAYYQPSGPQRGLQLCYEYPEFVGRMAPAETTPEGFTREEVILGGFLSVVFHELGHAVFHLLDVPMFGREEDAADQISAFIMLQFGKNVARRTLTGGAYVWQAFYSGRSPWPRTLYSDTHGHDLQRYYNILCIAYGGDPETFKALVESGPLPPERARNCGREYQQIRRAFVDTILPHIDQDLMKKVQARDWLRPDDGK